MTILAVENPKGGVFMDEIIKKIIDIDNKGKELKQKKENMLKKNAQDFETELKSIEDEYYRNGQMLGRMEYERLVEEGEFQAERIRKDTKEKLEKMNREFESIREDMVKEILMNIVGRD